MIFLNVLYGLITSGKRWAGVIHGILKDIKFTPSKADPCIWLSKAPNLRCYEYIAVYVDDLCIAAESPRAISDIFKTKYNLRSKEMENQSIILVLTILKIQMEFLLANLRSTLIS